MLEDDIEQDTCDYAKETYEVICIKLNLMGNKGLPDRLFLGKGAKILFIEFKKPGEEPRKLQVWWHKLLKRYGFNVSVVDSKEKGKEEINKIFS